ncbi:hypothetical protein CIB95_10115 [Lottiidibacillus patelloidae]|uniref:DUF554 domain-containing protein n=1 Tax=Lottiidibacillus patelloidae TaxID=2670334 RepID=A0A263BS98_9BACI|nr:DUF554 domain-containing protein [Lottiidibacillus patelloidae]OZM56575.1 hypothetical protein CIB95_10115 [Lottiidibacillus patelloidae]
MVLLGTIVNGLAIIAGTMLGKVLTKIPEDIKKLVMQGISLAVIVLGMQMAFKSEEFLIVIGSLVVGAILGELWRLDGKLNDAGLWLERKIGAKEEGSVAKGFVTATLIFVVGALAILGSLDSGLRGDHTLLYTKSLIDGFTSLFLTTTLGIGVIFSAIPVVLYQGFIALFAVQIEKIVPEAIMNSFIKEMTATGGIMIMAIGLNLLGITKIKVANLLPAIIVVALIVTGLYYMEGLFF